MSHLDEQLLFLLLFLFNFVGSVYRHDGHAVYYIGFGVANKLP